ncbi:restriction endonuclease subunit S [Pseudoalteromonas sp. 20-MNA-CIBAN-0454]|uniref:restriction endonuclease subunit S n=1 Tax=Pseudoalteromonas sp. 20-MNA-CIBAN-0454 TaxID=3140424 RepID=UPI00332289A7
MGSNWKELTIDELKAPTKSAIAMGPFGSRIKAENFVDSGVPILKGGNLHKAFITEDKLDYLTVSKAEELKTSQAIRRDLVITHRGTIGQVSIIPDNSLHDKYIVSQSQLKVTLNQDLVNPYYVNYFFRSRLGQHRLLANSSQVGVPAIAKASTSVKSILVPCPDLKEQNKIVEILSSFDNKIELNRQTNQTLEQMAQALFKSWFVDFDPVFDNLLASVDFNLENLETSLPDELKQKAQRRLAALNSLHNAAECKASLSALAHELQALSQTKEATQAAEKGTETPVKANFNTNPNILTQHANTHAHFPNEFEYNEQLGWIPRGWKQKYLSDLLEVKYGKDHKKLDDGKYPVYGSGGLMRYAESFLYEGESVLIPRKGTLSNIMHINGSFWTVDTMFYTIPKVLKVAKFMFYHMKALDFAAMNVGSAVPSMTTKVLNSLELLFPSVEVLCKFDRVIEDYFKKIDFNKVNINQLESLRDTLLPKLISGELQIPDSANVSDNNI